MTPDELRAWRQQAGLSQTGLAALLGVHTMTVSRWERGVYTTPTSLNLALDVLMLERDVPRSSPRLGRSGMNP